MADKELKPSEKKEVQSVTPEETTGLPWFYPHVDIYETDAALTIVADMPGVDGKDVSIDLKDNVLSLQASISKSQTEGMTPVYREYGEGNYYRQFILSEIVDQGNITAELNEGVLRLTLPKVERARPRRIEVKSP